MVLSRDRWLVLVLLASVACGEAASDLPCPEGTIRAGEVCIPEESVGVPEPDPEPGVDPEPDPEPTPDSEPDPDPDMSPDSLPLAVDDVYAASGYMGDGEQGAIVDEVECAEPRPGAGSGLCHKFTYTPGGVGWGGVFWQFPEGNWGELPGYDMPEGATRVSFYAWGAQGGEVVKFLSGMGDADGFAFETDEMVLGTEPTLYSIVLRGIEYGEVVGPFGWVADGTGGALSFFVDDIQWLRAEEDLDVDPDPESMAIPFAVDDVYAASGYMGDGEQGAIVDEVECAEPRPGAGSGLCHKFTYTPGGVGWGGVFWQFPEGNWGELPGLSIDAGAAQVSFYAWGAQGGEVVKFLVGMSGPDGFALETAELALTVEPTRHVIDLSQIAYSDVVGGFGWVADGVQGPITLFLDDIRWE